MPSDLSSRDKDLVIRTILGEAAQEGPQGQAAVAHVILNRLAVGDYGKTASAVVLAPNQFEPWSNRSKELMAISPNSAAYRNVADILDMSASGEVPDPTNGATHFYAPALQAKLGRSTPSWAKDPTAKIGGHVFYAPQGKVVDPVDAINRAFESE